MKLVIVDVKLTEEDPEPEAKLDEGEHIVKRVVEVKDLWKTLEGESERSADPDLYSKPSCGDVCLWASEQIIRTRVIYLTLASHTSPWDYN